MNVKKHHLFSKERHLKTRNVFEGLSICSSQVHSRAESAIAFSRLHPEAAKEINPVNPACLAIAVAGPPLVGKRRRVNPVRKYFGSMP
jgi:hypothetical protein